MNKQKQMKILPCPFCGSKIIAKFYHGKNFNSKNEEFYWSDVEYSCKETCFKSFATIYDKILTFEDMKYKLIELMNKRYKK